MSHSSRVLFESNQIIEQVLPNDEIQEQCLSDSKYVAVRHSQTCAHSWNSEWKVSHWT